MTEPSGRSVVERFARALQNKDFDEIEALVTDDFTDEMPQSGERVRGKANQLAILRNYPGGVGMKQQVVAAGHGPDYDSRDHRDCATEPPARGDLPRWRPPRDDLHARGL